MNKWILLTSGFLLILISVWLLLFSTMGAKECPEELTSDYYSCSNSNECYFHLKYECINRNKVFSCVITDDLSARQGMAELFNCSCVKGRCVTAVIH